MISPIGFLNRISYCGKHFPNANNSLGEPLSRILRRNNAQISGSARVGKVATIGDVHGDVSF